MGVGVTCEEKEDERASYLWRGRLSSATYIVNKVIGLGTTLSPLINAGFVSHDQSKINFINDISVSLPGSNPTSTGPLKKFAVQRFICTGFA